MTHIQQQPPIHELLASALREEEFVLYCQEIRRTAPKVEDGAFQEILIRFQQEEDTLLPPGTFFPVLEEHGLMRLLDRWVVSKLLRWIHSALAIDPAWLVPCSSVNLSRESVTEPGFADFVEKHLLVSGIPGCALVFELAWPCVTQYPTQARALMARVKPLGCRFVVAGFENPEECMGKLRSLKPDFVKISPRLLRSLKPDSPASRAVRVINAACRPLGIATIAEQIESDEAVLEVGRLGLDYVQGFAVSHPRPLY